MTTHAILDRCNQALVVLSRDGDHLVARPIEGAPPIPPELVQLLKDHKADLLTLLDYMTQADALLLASTKLLASVWPPGCPLDTPTWENLEEGVGIAYWSEDLAALHAALVGRDGYALDVFGRYRKERAT